MEQSGMIPETSTEVAASQLNTVLAGTTVATDLMDAEHVGTVPKEYVEGIADLLY